MPTTMTPFFAVLLALIFGAVLATGIELHENTKLNSCWQDLKQERTRNEILDNAINRIGNKWRKRDAISQAVREHNMKANR